MPWSFSRPKILSRGPMGGQGTPTLPLTITFAWNANTESDLAGYKLYAGRVSGNYTGVSGSPKDMGNVVTGTFTIDATGDWFFALTAYDTALLESGFSNEVIFNV